MSLLRLSILTALVLVFLPGLTVQNPSFQCIPGKNLASARGESLIGEVQTAYGSIRSLKGSFTQSSYLNALDVSELSSGGFWFEKPGRMKWHYKEPEEQMFTVRDKTLWLYQPNDNQVIVDNFSALFISDLPVAFLLGLGDLKRDFKLSQACESEDGILLDLVPRGVKKNREGEEEGVRGFKLLVRPQDKVPTGAQVEDVAGNLTTIVMGNLDLNSRIEEGTFDLSFPKGTDVNDRRLGEEG